MTTATVSVTTTATLTRVKDQDILLLPEEDSIKLPSRGQISVTGKLNGHDFTTVLEPDGRWSHWIRVTEALKKDAAIKDGDVVRIELTPTKVWPEPTIPHDIKKALDTSSQKVKDKWKDITPMARWEWIRWVNSTGNTETRSVRIEKTISKLEGKHRRPCCFNLAACTDPDLSKSGRLIQVA
jgi:hypothetical protein